LLGGRVDATFARAARHGEGWIHSGGPPTALPPYRDRLLQAWRAHGRQGQPRVVAIAYWALGPAASREARRYLGHYYEFRGSAAVEAIVSATITDEGEVAGRIKAYEHAGCDELILHPCIPDPDQVDLLAGAVHDSGHTSV
jgi:alkanesulfonate monooxygenase SsuD/methylene tetrahydromethanopterin reductase-like flavin-dependent oxidoreductase (luciferase family)